ncbi:alpha-tubulin suppressor-like RCC1 family protein [Hymenobacter sp. UYAg731]
MPQNFYRSILLVVCLLGASRHQALAQPETIALGNGHTLVIHANGTLWACGYNGDGRLGDGTTTNRLRPVQIGTGTTWRTVSTGGRTGDSYVLALQTDGSLWSWGNNNYGQLGHPSGVGGNTLVPQLVVGGPWACAAAGQNHSVAVRADGTLWTWGYNGTGQLGEGGVLFGRSAPGQVGTDNDWASVSAGTQYTLALKRDGSLWAWGLQINLGIVAPGGGNTYVPTQVGTSTNWVRICAGAFSLGIRADGTLWGWGQNFSSVLTPLNTSYVDTPTQLGAGTTWSRVAGGASHILGVQTDGTLWSWGNNNRGSVGNASRTDATAPVQVGSSSSWRRVAAGGFTSAADQANGALFIWGDSQAGQSGDPALTLGSLPAPVQVGTAANWTMPGATPDIGMGLRSDGSLWTWGSDNGVMLGDGPIANRQNVARIDSPATYIRLSGNDYHVLALRADSSLWAWGDNQRGQLGDGTIITRSAPVAIAPGPWKQVATGDLVSLAIRVDGSLWAWGDNDYGQLGDGTTVRRTRPVQIGTSRDWAQVVCLGSFSLGLRTDGTLWAWGRPGTFGNGSTSIANQLIPLRIGTVATWSQLAVSDSHVLALRLDGTLWAWGFNSNGQLGDGTTSSRALPTRIGTDTDWATIAAGINGSYGNFSLALKRNGTLWTWGNNTVGQLGHSSPPNYTYTVVPTQVGTAAWTTVAAGSIHALAVRADGTLWEWGSNLEGQSGIPSFSLRPASVQTGMRPFVPFNLAAMSPVVGVTGSTVTLTGVGLGAAQLVTFGGVVAPGFTVNAGGTVLTATVPVGARSGSVAILGPDGTAWSAATFQVLVAPTVSSFAPLAAAPGSTITVYGTNLTGATSLQLGGVSITGLVVGAGGTSLTFVVPAGSSGGFISVSTPAGTATSASTLNIILATQGAVPATTITVVPTPVRAGQPLALTGLPAGPLTIQTFSLLGQKISNAAWPSTHDARLVLGLAPANAGVYLLIVTTPTQVLTRRIVVE